MAPVWEFVPDLFRVSTPLNVDILDINDSVLHNFLCKPIGSNSNYVQCIIWPLCSSALNISTGPAHFSYRRASTGQYIVSFTGPAGPPS